MVDKLVSDIKDGKDTLDDYQGIDINFEQGLYLEVAIRYNHINIVKRLVEKGININIRPNNDFFRLALQNKSNEICEFLLSSGFILDTELVYLACEYNNIKILRHLINYRHYGECMYYDPYTAVERAVEKGNVTIVKYFLAKSCTAFINQVILFKIYNAAYNGHLKIVKYFIDLAGGISTLKTLVIKAITGSYHGKRLKILEYIINYYNEYISEDLLYNIYIGLTDISILKCLDKTKKIKWHGTALKKAVERRNITLLKYLVNFCTNENINEALGYSAKNGYLTGVKYLVSKGACVHAQDNYALRFSAENGHLKVVKYLVSLGAKEDVALRKALMGSAENRHLEVVKYLVSQGANVRAGNDYALRWSAGYGHLEIVKYLVSQAADIHAEHDEALRWSARNGQLEVVKFLVEQGADIYAEENFALRYAASNGHLEVVKYLVEQGANVCAENDYALRWSAQNGHLEVVKYLVSQGANIHAQNEFALIWSAHNKRMGVVNYLISEGADIKNAIEYFDNMSDAKNILKKYIKKEMYKGPINDQTELDCGICLTEMNTENQEIIQCYTCKKCIHHSCGEKWNGKCIYCRN
jgi:ankyrin repeat protein